MTYSNDMRKKAIEYVESGASQKEAADAFGVTSRTIWNWIQRNKEGKLGPKKYETSPRKVCNKQLVQYIQKHPDAYLREIAEEFSVDLTTIFYAFKRLKITLKKRHRVTKKEAKRKENDLLQK